MITTTMMTSVVRIVSSRVGQTTLRNSNCDSTRYSRIERPALREGADGDAARRCPPSARRSARRRTSRRSSSRRRRPPISSSTASVDITTSIALPAPAAFSIFAFIVCLSDACRDREIQAGFLPAFAITARPSDRISRLSGTPGGTRTPNLRFWRPLLCQLSYWRVVRFPRRRRALACFQAGSLSRIRRCQ